MSSLDDFFNERKKALGISHDAPSQPQDLDSFFNSRKMDLGLTKDTRPNTIHANENAQYADLMKQAYQSNPDSFPQSHPAPEPQGPSFLQQAGGVAKNIGSSALHGVGAALNAVGTGIDKFETVTGLKNIGSAVKGLISPEQFYKPDESHGNSYLGNLQNLGSEALTSIKNAGKSAYEGLIHPDQADQRFQQNLNTSTNNLDPVTKYSARFLGNAGTDPLTFIPIPVAPVVKAFRGIKGAAESGLAGKVIKDAKLTPESSVSKYAAEREAIQTPEAAAIENVTPAPSAEPIKQNWFTNLFGKQGVGITPFGSSKRIGTKPVSTEDAIVNSAISKETSGFKDSVEATARAAYQNHVDALSPFKKVNEVTYETAMDSARANNIANNIVGKDFVNLEGVRVGDGLETILKKVPRGQDKAFMDYLIKRDALSRMSRGERVYDESLGMTPERIQADIARFEKQFPGADKVAADWNNFNKNVRTVLGVNEGLISSAQEAAMQASRPNYIRMQRQFSKSEKPSRNFIQNSSASTFSGQKAPIKSVSPTGSARNIVDPRRTTIEAIGAWTNAAFRNRAGQQIVKAIQENPAALKGVAEIVPETAEVTQKSLKEIDDILQSDGVDGLLEKLNSEFDLAFKKGAQKGGEDNIVTFMVDGNPVKVRLLDPELMKAVSGMSPQQSGLVIDVLSKFSNATKRGATGLLAPVFAVKGATMDLVQSAIQAKNPIQQAGYTIHAILSGIGDKLNIPGLKNLAEEFRLAGGEYSAALKGDRQLNKSISKLTRPPVLSPQGVAKGAWNTIKAPFNALEAVGNIAENAPRIAAYKGELKRLGGVKTPENVRQAMSAARESTVNFSRKGAFSKELESVIPYNNAAIQGTYRVMKAFKNNPVRTTAAVGALAVLPKLFEYAQFHDDPDYQSLPARERMRFLIVNKNKDGSFTKIPMEPAYNSIGEMTIEALRKFKDNDPTAFKGSADALLNAWTPPMVTGALQGATQGTGVMGSLEGAANSTVGAPLIATIANKSFTGAPIESAAVTDRSPQFRYDEKTSGVAKKLGEITGFSPMKTDYLLRAYGGDPARLLLPLTSQVGAGNTRNTLLKNFIVDPTITNNLTNDFYGAKDRLTKAYRDNQEVGAPLPKWYDEGLRKSLSSTANGSYSKQLSFLSDEKKTITADKSLTAEQKTQRLRDTQSKMNNIYLDINTKLQQKGVPVK